MVRSAEKHLLNVSVSDTAYSMFQTESLGFFSNSFAYHYDCNLFVFLFVRAVKQFCQCQLLQSSQ